MEPDLNNNQKNPENMDQSAAPQGPAAAGPAPSREEVLKETLSQISEEKPAPNPAPDPIAPQGPEPMKVPQQSIPTPPPASGPQIPASLRATPQKPGSSKAVGILITILLIGLIAVAGVFAAKLSLGPNSGENKIFLSATESFLNQETYSYNAIFSSDFKAVVDDTSNESDDMTVNGIDTEEGLYGPQVPIFGNMTFVADTVIKQDSLQSKGNFYLNMNDGMFDISVAFINKDNDLYLSIDSFTLNLTDNSPQELQSFTFFPVDQFTQRWIRLSHSDVSNTITNNITGTNEELTQTDMSNRYIESLQTLKDQDWKKAVLKHIAHLPEQSTNTNLAYSTNLTIDGLTKTLTDLNMIHLIEDVNPDDLKISLDFINNLIFYISKDTETLSSITSSDFTYDDELSVYELTSNLTITPIDRQDFEAPANHIDLQDLLGQIFKSNLIDLQT